MTRQEKSLFHVDLDTYITTTLPKQFWLAAFLLVIGFGADLPQLAANPVRIICIRAILVLGAVSFAVISRYCCKKRTTVEIIVFFAVLAQVTGMALLGWTENTYLTGYMSAIYQILAFLAIFISLRLVTFLPLTIVVGLLWFWGFPTLFHLHLDHKLFISHIIGYLTYSFMVLEGSRRFHLLWAEVERRRISLEAHTKNLQELATQDGLTGVYNFRHFQYILPILMEQATSCNEPICICLIDIDEFKMINDLDGHLYGNSVLQHVTRCILDVVRRDDAVFRIGGDEFAVIFPGATAEHAHLVAQRIQAVLASEKSFEGVEEPVRAVYCSIGIAELIEEWSRPELLMEAADRAMYQAKEQGRNQIVVASAESDDTDFLSIA